MTELYHYTFYVQHYPDGGGAMDITTEEWVTYSEEDARRLVLDRLYNGRDAWGRQRRRLVRFIERVPRKAK